MPFGYSFQGNLTTLIEAIRSEPLTFPSAIPEKAKDCLVRMLDRNPQSRISVAELKQHPWVQIQSRMRGITYPPVTAVEVSMEEIDLAFTPVADFVLMTKLKLKMGRHLEKARDKISTKAGEKRMLSNVHDGTEKKKQCVIA